VANAQFPFRIPPDHSTTAAPLHAHDWASSPLGTPDTWPESLHIALGICLNSRFPMFVWWGDALVNFYNDAYSPILGKRHPAAFGQPAQAVWSEIWDVLGQQAEAVMQRGEATWNERVLLVMERHGYTEDTWFTWSYSPIHDGNGGIGGLFCACTEDTPIVHAERERDRLLGEIAYERAQLAEAFAQSPAFIATVRGPEHVFEFANARYLELVGQRDLIGLPVRRALPEVEVQGFIDLLDRVYTTGEAFTGRDTPLLVQRDPSRPMETRYVDFVYQPMRTADGEISGVLAHGMDVTERRNAEVRDRFFVELDDAVRPLTDAEQITSTCARLLGEHLDADRCAYADVEADEDTFNLTGDYNRGVPSIVGRYRFAAFGEEALRRMRSGQAFRVDDVDRHQPPLDDLSPYRQTHIQAVICVPVLKAGRFVAAMAVHQATPRVWTDGEVEIVVHVANRCWESIERARVERELRRSERRFRAAVDATSNIVWTCTADGEFVSEQPGWSQFTGQTFEQYRGHGWADAVHPDDVEATLANWHSSVSMQDGVAMQYRLRRRDGMYRVCSVRAVPVPGESGQAREWVGVHTDISERVEFEQSLQESEARFRTLSDHAPVMIWMTRADGSREYVSKQWTDFTGQPFDEALEPGWLDAIHPRDRERFGQVCRSTAAQRQVFSIEYALRRHDGVYRWCVDSGTPRFGARGEFLGYIGTVVDISERKRMEDMLSSEKRVLELIATGSPLHEVLDTLALRMESQSLDGMLCSVLLVSDDGRHLVHGAAPSLPEAFRIAADGLPIGPGIGTCGTAAFERATVVSADIAADPRWAGAHALAAEHGIAASMSNPVVSSDGRLLGTLAIYYRQPRGPGERDMELARLGTHLAGIVIEKHQLDQRLRQSLEAEQQARAVAERANRSKDEFLATLSHELRSPLNAILGWVAILRLKAQLPPDLLQAIDVIERNARAQSQIIADLLDMNAIASGKIVLDLQHVSLAELVTSAVETAMPAAQARHVHIDTSIDPQAVDAIDGDPNRLQQVMWNLLSNAVKFTPRDGRIDVRLQRRGMQLEIVVSDSGEGIEPGFLPYVFDRFRQADSSISRRHGGLGLGLSIVRRIVELHGGRVHARSAGRGQGATFIVELPLRSTQPGDPADSGDVYEAAGSAGQLAGVRVLVVDDDADARLMTRRLLEGPGAEVEAAASADEALAMLAARPFDMLVSDIGMPGGDGYELLRRLRAAEASPNREVPAIALTAYARMQDRVRALQAGFQRHLAKPVEPAELLDAVAALAGRSLTDASAAR
jgi:PAS domain S-box-containing protein